MRKGVLLFFFTLMAMLANQTSFAQCTTLVWYDEFEGSTLDQSKWAYVLGRGCDQPSGCGFGNGEEQAYTNQSKNISVGGGNLTITAIFDNPEPGAAFSSAKIQTLGLKTFQYGKIETRMKLSSGQGAWPAFWMLAQSNNWPYTGEIDIMEAKHKNPTQLLGTVHHYNGHNSGQVTTPDLSAAFHTYAIEWEKDEIRWYFDGALYHRATPQTTGGAWPFNNTGNPFYLIYNLAVGGLGTPFTGNQPFNSADFPTNIQVDYVRVYSGTWNVEFNGDPYVYKGENSKVYSITPVAGAGYNWTVPAGATIASGQGTNSITVNFGTGAVSGNINVAVTSGCTTQNYVKAVTVEEAFKVTSTLKDWDANNNMTFVSASGTLTQVANPSGSGNVGRYVRNGGQLYDNIIHKNIAFGNASDFLTRRRRIRADIYTSAPVGTKIRIQLENAAKSSQTFPVGRHSVYETKTTRQNAWETVEFEYVNSPDLGTGSTTVDQMAILFAVETNSSDTYHIDNIVIGTAGDLCPRVLNQTLEDFQTNRNITYNSSTGTLTTVSNPAPGGVNTSATVGRYARNSAELYDVLFYKNVSLNNVANFKNGKSIFKMQVYSGAPVGTTISLQLETSASTPSNYPTGRHSLYQGVTASQNQWETIEFSYVSSLDALAQDSQVNSIVFLFSPGSNNGSVYHFDNLITEAENCTNVAVTGVTVSPTSASIAAAGTQQLTATVAPANATNKNVTWTSSNTAAATVNSSGLVTAVAQGTATITVTTQDGNRTATSAITVTTGNVIVTGVTVSPTSASKVVGTTQQLTATVAPANATNKNVTWSSSNPAVATVNSSGLVSAIAVGTATITVTTQDQAKTATSTITVTSTGLPSPWITADVGAVGVAGSASHSGSTFTAQGSGADIWGTADEFRYIYQTVSGNVTITARVATLGNTDPWAKAGVMIRETTAANSRHAFTGVTIGNGLAFQRRLTAGAESEHTAGPAGAAPYWVRLTRAANVITSFVSTNGTTWTQVGAATTITMATSVQVGLAVTSHNDAVLNTATFDNVTVSTGNVPVTGVTVSPTSASINVGATQQLTATVAPANATNKNVTWTSSNSAIASVNSSGLVTGVAAGTATITVTTQDGNRTATSSITVNTTPIPVTGVTVSPTTASINVGATQQLTATVAPANATNKTVTWTTSNGAIATVNGTGLVTGVAAGTATITVTTQDGNRTASSAITVNTVPGGTDITNLSGGIVTAQWDDSPAAERFPNLIDNNINTKYLTFHNAGWVQFQAPASYVVNRYTLTSANDAAERDPLNWTLQGSTNGSTWVTINTQSAQDFPSRLQTRSFTFTNTTGYAYYRFNLTNNSGTLLQLAEFELFGTPVSNGVCTGNGPIASGQSVADYRYEISTSGNVSVKFIPGTPIAGCDMAIFYYRMGTGGYVGSGMTASGGTFTSSVSIPNGSAIQFYFTYRRSAGGMESNSSATPHSYTVGTTCSGARAAAQENVVTYEEEAEDVIEVYPVPAKDELHYRFAKTFEGGVMKIVDALGKERTIQLTETQGTLNVAGFTPGLYIMRVSKEKRFAIKRFIKE